MEFSFGEQASSQSSSQGVTSDRLKKAIERNRAKQAKRMGRSSESHKTFSASSRTWTPPKSSSNGLRKSVARADEEAEFSTDIKRRARTSAKAEYLPAKPIRKRRITTRKKAKTDKDFAQYLVIGSWIFCGFLFLRLIFSGGGVIDYYNGKNHFESRVSEHARIVDENQELRYEIEQIQTSSSYQRQLVRDHLGYIASDEYLVIFPGRVASSSL